MNEESRKIIEKLKALEPQLKKDMRIKRLRVFGSVARGEARVDSDVDLLVDFEKIPGLITYVGYQRRFAEHLGHDVDLLTERSIHPALKDRILKEAEDVWT